MTNIYITSNNLPNGMDFTSPTFSLGGTLSQSIEFKGNNFDLTGGQFGTISYSSSNYLITTSFSSISTSDGVGFSQMIIDPDVIFMTSSLIDVTSEIISLDSTNSIQILADEDISVYAAGQISLAASSSLVSIANTEGLVYAADYSGGFITHSLVDKLYVDNAVSMVGGLGADNGLSIESGNYVLGGTLSQNTTINADLNSLTIDNINNLTISATSGSTIYLESTSDSINKGYIYVANNYVLLETDFDFGSYSYISAEAGQVYLEVTNGSNYNSIRMVLDSEGIADGSTDNFIIIQDDLGSKGLVYASDYSTNFTTFSLVTKGYVDNAVSMVGGLGADNGLSIESGNYVLGGTLSQNTTIQGNGNQLLMLDLSTTKISATFGSGNASDLAIDGSSLSLTTYDDKDDPSGTYSVLELYYSDGISLESGDYSGVSGIFRISPYGISSNDGSGNNYFKIDDQIGQKGIVYQDDYSSNFTTFSLVTKGYVDNAVSMVGVSGTGSTGYLATWITSTDLGTGSIYDNGTFVGINTTTQQSSEKLRVNGDGYFDGSLVVAGDLTISGTATYIYTKDLLVEDNKITLNATWSGPPLLNSGIEIYRDTELNASLLWDETDDIWKAGLSGSEVSILLNAGIGLTKSSSTVNVSVDNGIDISNNNIVLGGTLSQTTTINANSIDFNILNAQNIFVGATSGGQINLVSGDLDYNSGEIHIFDSASYIETIQNFGTYSYVGTDQSGVLLELLDNVGNLRFELSYTGQSIGDGSSDNHFVVTDTLTNKGIVYGSDYSANFTTYSLVTKGWVESQVLSGPQGATGATGADGAVGSTGSIGATGATGPVGPIDTLSDVYAPSPSNNDGIFWVSANSRYENQSITGVLGFTPEDVSNKDIDVNLSSNSDTLYPSQKAVKTYVDASVTGLLDDRGNYDASTNLFPSTNGSGVAGAVVKGDLWYISSAGTLGGGSVSVGSSVRALVDLPGQTASNWGVLNVGLGYTPENSANKGVANGYASLDSAGKVPNSQLPSPRVYSTASAISLSFSVDSYDAIDVTAQTTGITFSNPTGSPSNFQKIMIRIKDDGTARAITWQNKYVSRGSTLPSSTSAGKYYTLGFIYNSAGSGTWDLVALAQET